MDKPTSKLYISKVLVEPLYRVTLNIINIIHLRAFAKSRLPVGLGCKRGDLAKENAPEIPDLKISNYMFSAEVIYRKIDRSGDDVQLYSYYSTLYMAMDLFSNHLAYRSTAWKKSSTTTEEPDVEFPQNIVFDMKHGKLIAVFFYKNIFKRSHELNANLRPFSYEYEQPNTTYNDKHTHQRHSQQHAKKYSLKLNRLYIQAGTFGSAVVANSPGSDEVRQDQLNLDSQKVEYKKRICVDIFTCEIHATHNVFWEKPGDLKTVHRWRRSFSLLRMRDT
ncbi:UNVERIFIED_CONTAM: hypothetical protein NCL1_38316 [Trichonephila clavipes]